MLLLLSASPKVLGDVLYPPVEDFLLVQAIGLPLEVVLEIFVPLVLVAATEGEVVLAALPKQVLDLLVEGTEPPIQTVNPAGLAQTFYQTTPTRLAMQNKAAERHCRSKTPLQRVVQRRELLQARAR